ncbi:MAG: nitroreductase family protein [Firmicutes bacterium]|nr:nitroreductase family protein [Bacillota bacterium]
MVIVDTEKCIGCGACEKDCLLSEIHVIEGKAVPNNKTCFNCGHCVAICPVGAVRPQTGEEEVVPMTAEECRVNTDNLMNSFRFRRTIRTFQNKKIDREDLEKILEAGRISPTGMNSQEIRFVVFDKDLKELTERGLRALSDLAEDYFADPEAPKAMVAYSHMWKRMNKQYFEEGIDRLFYDPAAVVVVLANTKYNKLTPPIDGAIACANMEMLARSMGMGTCYIGFLLRAVLKDPSLKEFIGLKEHEELITAFSIGYPGVKYYRTVPRKKDKVEWR